MPTKPDQSQLFPHHREILERAGISAEVVKARGYSSVGRPSDLADTGLVARQRQRAPAMLIPLFDRRGNVSAFMTRPDTPQVRHGQPVEFEAAPEMGLVLDTPPASIARLADPQAPLVLAGNVFETDAALSHGFLAATIVGESTGDSQGKRTAVRIWKGVPLQGRVVYLLGATGTNGHLDTTWRAVAVTLKQLGAEVHILRLPRDSSGERLRLNAFLMHDGAAGHLFKLAVQVDSEAAGHPSWVSEYTLAENGTIWHRPTPDGVADVPLANFTARIVEDAVVDEGLGEENDKRVFTVEARLGSRTVHLEIASAQFARMNWPIEQIGPEAIVAPVPNAKDHLRMAIQLASGEIRRSKVYGHTGWTSVDSHGFVYLHSGGAIGAAGPVDGIEVRLEGTLSNYKLPAPPSPEVAAERIRASLSLCGVVAERVSIPILAAVYRAAVGDVDVSLFLSGATGVGKSEIAALAQQHFGAGLDARNLPGSWTSTANSLEELAFLAKDALFVIDDFVSTDGLHAQQLNGMADRVFRAQGNRSGRQRMRSDLTVSAQRPPRGLIVATGEELPRGHSLNARILHIEVSGADLRLPDLTELQRRAASGELAEAMAGFITFLAARKGELDVRARIAALRGEMGASHPRTREAAANIGVGWQLFLQYAQSANAIDPEEAATLWARGWRAIGDLANEQASFQRLQEPTRHFFDLLRGAMASERAYVEDLKGGWPKGAEKWGWRLNPSNMMYFAPPKSERIGWVDGDALYLEPRAAHRVAQSVSAVGGDSFQVGIQTLKQRLRDKGLLVVTSASRETLTVRKSFRGVRIEVLHLRETDLWADDAGLDTVIPPSTNPTNPTTGPMVGMVNPTGGEAQLGPDISDGQLNPKSSEAKDPSDKANLEDES